MSDAVDPHLGEPVRAPNQLLRHRTRLPRLRLPHAAARHRLQVPGLRRGPRHRLRLRARQAADRRARPRASARGTSGASRSCCRSSTARAQERVGQFAGQTPLIRADRLGAELGLSNLYLKDDSTNRPSLSYKDRVVSMAIARAARAGQGRDRLRLDRQRRHRRRRARRQGRRHRPTSSTRATWRGARRKACRALGAQVCQLDGNYDQANRACRELALASGIEFANITLRPFYAEGAKTMAFEVVEQLGWTLARPLRHPGGRRHPLLARPQGPERAGDGRPGARPRATKINIAQAERLLADRDRDPRAAARSSRRRRRRAAHSLAIGAPGDGAWSSTRCAAAAARRRPPPTRRSSSAIDLLGATEGILTEPAGGTTIAATAKLAAEGQDRPRRHRRRRDQRQRPEDAQRAPGQALAGNGPLRRRDDGGGAQRLPPGSRRRRARAPDARRRSLAGRERAAPRRRASATAGSGRAGSTSTSPKRARATTSSSACTAGRSTGTSGAT